MRYFGVVYDVGLRFSPDVLSVDPFDPQLVAYDMQTISQEMHSNAVRIEGEDIERLATATRIAHENGLAVFFNPWKMNADIEETRAYLSEAATTAEQLREEGVDIVFVTGCELSIFTEGIYPGSSFMERGMWMGSQLTNPESETDANGRPIALAERAVVLNQALRTFVETIRQQFNGPVTYSSGLWEDVDWEPFDIVGVDAYRHGEPAEQYLATLERYKKDGKPVGALEFGCCAYEGAAARGDGGFAILQGENPDGTGIFEGGVVPTRSEREQADYVGEQLQLLEKAGFEMAFVFVFSFPAYKLGEGSKDRDMVGFSLVKTFADDDPRSKDMPPWEPKEAFHRAAEFFKEATATVH